MSGSTRKQPGFKTDAVSHVYAQSLFELAQQHQSLDAVALEIERLADMLADDTGLRRLITSRALSRDQRAGLIDRIFKGSVSELVYKFLHVLNRKGRIESLPAVTASFAGLVAESRGIVEVDAYVAQRLDDAEADRVAKSIGQALGGKQVVLHQYVDESLIGGLKLRVGDRMIDGSVATQLARLKREIVAAGREKARQQVAAEA